MHPDTNKTKRETPACFLETKEERNSLPSCKDSRLLRLRPGHKIMSQPLSRSPSRQVASGKTCRKARIREDSGHTPDGWSGQSAEKPVKIINPRLCIYENTYIRKYKKIRTPPQRSVRGCRPIGRPPKKKRMPRYHGTLFGIQASLFSFSSFILAYTSENFSANPLSLSHTL